MPASAEFSILWAPKKGKNPFRLTDAELNFLASLAPSFGGYTPFTPLQEKQSVPPGAPCANRLTNSPEGLYDIQRRLF